MDYVGIDLHKKESQICLLTETGEVIERRIRTESQRFAEVLGGRPRARILVEASTESEWVARCLEALGHEVVVADPNFAPMYATRTRKVKTDRRDARALQEACLLGAYRPAHRLSDAQRHVRGRLAVRDALVRTRTGYIALTRALLRRHGWRVPTGSAETFSRRVLALSLPGPCSRRWRPCWRPCGRSISSSPTRTGRSRRSRAVMSACSACGPSPAWGRSRPRPSWPRSTTRGGFAGRMRWRRISASSPGS